jgi:hypothetical protein
LLSLLLISNKTRRRGVRGSEHRKHAFLSRLRVPKSFDVGRITALRKLPDVKADNPPPLAFAGNIKHRGTTSPGRLPIKAPARDHPGDRWASVTSDVTAHAASE